MNRILALLFPPKCVFCQKLLKENEEHICEGCKKSLKYCGAPYAAKKPYYEKAYAAFHYSGAARSAILRYKFYGFKSYADYFAGEMADIWENAGIKADLIVSPPSSVIKAFKKGYDHAFLLAKRVSEKTGVPAGKALFKTRRTKPMYGLAPAERRANVSDSIGFKGDVSNKTVLIVDDILTTGATASECARTLKNNGAKEVYVLAATAKK